MAKKSLINLESKNITYEDKGKTIKLLSFKKSNMTLEISILEDNKPLKTSTIVFAHLPKKIKALIKPL